MSKGQVLKRIFQNRPVPMRVMDQIRDQVHETFATGQIEGDMFEKNINKLVSVMGKLTADDVNLDKSLLQPRSKGAAPVTYIEILEHPRFTINMFVLRPGCKLPLHDHPRMHGICKVVHGKVKIRNFSLDKSPNCDKEKHVFAHIEPEKIVSESDGAVLLTPEKGNIHEILALEGGAAFVDVLSPPYLSNIDGHGPRLCQYFKEVESSLNGYAEFIRVGRIPEYWTDFSPYLGP